MSLSPSLRLTVFLPSSSPYRFLTVAVPSSHSHCSHQRTVNVTITVSLASPSPYSRRTVTVTVPINVSSMSPSLRLTITITVPSQFLYHHRHHTVSLQSSYHHSHCSRQCHCNHHFALPYSRRAVAVTGPVNVTVTVTIPSPYSCRTFPVSSQSPSQSLFPSTCRKCHCLRHSHRLLYVNVP